MINFLKYKYISFAASFLFISAGIGSYLYHGGFRYSVDFTGGTQVLLRLNKIVHAEQVKNALVSSDWEDPVVREFGNGEVLVRVQEFSNDSRGLSLKIKEKLEASSLEVKAEVLEANGVGPGVGSILRLNSLLMLLFSLLAVLGYIAFRFWSFSFGAGAVFAIFHDSLIILSLFSLTQKEISPNVIIAIITTLGYSVNDTIVIFAKIRENLAKISSRSLESIVNTSLNQTMRRTLLTSLSTGLVVAALFFFGGETLRNLSLALLVGIIVGTYSSVYIASPVMLFLRRRS